MIRLYIYILLLLSSLTALFFYVMSYKKSGEYSQELFASILVILPTSLGAIVEFLYEHRKSLLLSLRCLIHNRDEEVYVSLSYLFRIKLRGKNEYLMVRGNKIAHQYQPVGGVYKKFASLDSNWQKWDAREAKNNVEDSDDLRFYVKKKFIPEIRRWFYTSKNREIDVWREFCEELISSEILPNELFKHIKPEFLYSVEEPLIERKGISGKQFLVYNIFSIKLNQKQEEALFKLYNQSKITEEYAFVEEDFLDKELFTIKGQEKEHLLGYHAKYLKSNK